MAEVRLARQAQADLDALPARTARRFLTSLDRLSEEPSGAGLDVKLLAGRRPWRRLRVGNHRVVFMLAERGRIVLVARVVDRGDLSRAVLTLPPG